MRKKKATITIHTDASYNQGHAAWAYWIESPKGEFKDAGRIMQRVGNSSLAELLSFQEAFIRVLNEFEDARDYRLEVSLDNMWVVHTINGKRIQYPAISNLDMYMAKIIYESLEGFEIKATHIKSHSDKLTTQAQIANNWCDFNAREITRRLVANG